MKHVDILVEFFRTLDEPNCRIRRPDPFIFFCGGRTTTQGGFLSLRDYIIRNGIALRHRIVLAESAVSLFEDSPYPDLITFEAHVAQISELVLLVCESPGALAELGAFSQQEEIRKHLYVILKEEHYKNKSFVRLGPVRSLQHLSEDTVGSFPWSTNDDGSVSVASIENYNETLADEINSQLRSNVTEAFNWDQISHQILLVYWVCFMLRAATLREIENFLAQVGKKIESKTVKQFLYCMQVAGWLRERNLGKIYYIPHFDQNPLHYSYVSKGIGNQNRADAVKAAISNEITQHRLRSASVLDAIGAGDPPPVLSDGT